MKLRAKVNLALSGAFFVGLLVATGGAHKILTDEAVESSARDARHCHGAGLGHPDLHGGRDRTHCSNVR